MIIGPGDLYGSLLAVLLPNNVKATFARSSAQIIYVVNLMTRHLQTDGMTASDHVAMIEKYVGKKVDKIIINNSTIEPHVLNLYAESQELPVKDDLGEDPRVIRADIVADEVEQTPAQDKLHRSYLRHDTEKLLAIFKKIL